MSNPGANRGPFGRQPNFLRVPKGEVLGTYDTYPEAQAVVDRLAKAEFAVAQLSIVGNDLKSVERVTRKLSWSRAALEGALSGAWFGLFVAVLLTFFSPTDQLGHLRGRGADRRGIRDAVPARELRHQPPQPRLRVDQPGAGVELPGPGRPVDAEPGAGSPGPAQHRLALPRRCR